MLFPNVNPHCFEFQSANIAINPWTTVASILLLQGEGGDIWLHCFTLTGSMKNGCPVLPLQLWKDVF
jgi:hypothetical protein